MMYTSEAGQPGQYFMPLPAIVRAKNRNRLVLIALTLIVFCGVARAATQDHDLRAEPHSPMRVLVAGATGGTGIEIVRNLLADGYRVRALVRDEAGARSKFGADIEYALGDVREPATIKAALEGVDALISAVGGDHDDPDNGPEFVDYGGVRHMAEAAAAAGLRRFVLISSIGVTREDQVLNKMFDNVLEWKFKGEEALRASNVPYTIIRPGGLVDGPGGSKPLIFAQGDISVGLISRSDLARVCVAALGSAAAENKTFEVTSARSAKEGSGNENFDAEFAALKPDPETASTVSEQVR